MKKKKPPKIGRDSVKEQWQAEEQRHFMFYSQKGLFTGWFSDWNSKIDVLPGRPKEIEEEYFQRIEVTVDKVLWVANELIETYNKKSSEALDLVRKL